MVVVDASNIHALRDDHMNDFVTGMLNQLDPESDVHLFIGRDTAAPTIKLFELFSRHESVKTWEPAGGSVFGMEYETWTLQPNIPTTTSFCGYYDADANNKLFLQLKKNTM